MFYNLTDNKRLVLCGVCKKNLLRRDGCVAGSRHLIFPTRVGSLYAFAPRGQCWTKLEFLSMFVIFGQKLFSVTLPVSSILRSLSSLLLPFLSSKKDNPVNTT